FSLYSAIGLAACAVIAVSMLFNKPGTPSGPGASTLADASPSSESARSLTLQLHAPVVVATAPVPAAPPERTSTEPALMAMTLAGDEQPAPTFVPPALTIEPFPELPELVATTQF